MKRSAAKPLYRENDFKRLSQVAEPMEPEAYRSKFRQDYARLIHSPAFRRLQGKTQLFPGHESDFFRNRLTHSLEVAQIAKSIASSINLTHDYFKKDNINLDLIEFAALAHDLGHPPFGHNGEEALDECMIDAGGFEGNAQTLRLLAKIEKRATHSAVPSALICTPTGEDNRAGLNATYRSLASILKYNKEIPRQKADRMGLPDGAIKGYYYTEAPVIETLQSALGTKSDGSFRTIECSIMDIADDIAYSTYDLEDAFKARFLTPAIIIGSSTKLAEKVCGTVANRSKKYYSDLPPSEWVFTISDYYRTVTEIFSGVLPEFSRRDFFTAAKSTDASQMLMSLAISRATGMSEKLATDGYHRIRFTSELIKAAMKGIEVIFDEDNPTFSRARLNIETFRAVEVLKNLVYQSLIMSPMLKVSEYRGKEIVRNIFGALKQDNGYMLMPEDYKELYVSLKEPHHKERIICDFIAGMTNRYAIQFYGRLFGATPESIYSPI